MPSRYASYKKPQTPWFHTGTIGSCKTHSLRHLGEETNIAGTVCPFPTGVSLHAQTGRLDEKMAEEWWGDGREKRTEFSAYDMGLTEKGITPQYDSRLMHKNSHPVQSQGHGRKEIEKACSRGGLAYEKDER